MRLSSLLGNAAVAALLLTACGVNSSDTKSDSVDPQVMSDVVAATFTVPGPEVRRQMRVVEFGRGLAIRECGGSPLPVDVTYNRRDQSHFPDLDLIRVRGFAEQDGLRQEDEILAGLDPSCTDLAPDLTTQDDWVALGDVWNDVMLSADQDARLEPLKAPLADCLTSRTGRDVDATDPVNSYLRGVNLEASTDDVGAEQMAPLAVAYADCAEDYFATYRKILLEERPALVEKHREVIEAYAAELVDAGYVP